MMKKTVCAISAIVLVFALFITLAGCKKKEENGKLYYSYDDEGNIVSEYVETTTGNREAMDDERKVTMPLAFVDKKYHHNLDAYCKDYGYISCTLNEKDETVTVIMKALTYDLNLVRIGMQVMTSIGDAIDSGDYPYAKKLESYSENFDEIVMLVDGKGYKADKQSSLLPYMLGECGMYYQVYTTENKYQCKVIIKDADTGEELFSETYKATNSPKE